MCLAQEKKAHKKTYFVDSDKKLFWQAEVPFYLFITNNPKGKSHHLLKSEGTPAHANPMYFDTEGINYFRTSFAADSIGKPIEPKVELLWEAYKDSYAPVTTVTFSDAVKYVNEEGEIYFGPGLKTSAEALDQISGLEEINFSVDQEPYKTYSQPINYSENRLYETRFYSVDKVGNDEEVQTFIFIHDTEAPISEYEVLGDRSGNILSPRSRVKLSSVDYSSQVRNTSFRIDDNSLNTYNQEISLKNLVDGTHQITFFGTDNVSNKEEDKEFNFYLDATPPVVEATVLGDQYQNRGRVFISTRTKVQLKATDNKAGVKKVLYSIDGGPEKVYREPFTLDKSKGAHEVTFYAIDKVNNDYKGLFKEEYGGRKSLDMDMDAPEISHQYSGSQYFSRDTTFITSATEVQLIANDIESGVKTVGYKVNGKKGIVYGDPFKILEEGLYKIDYYGTDEVNNRNAKDFYFVVDNTGPKIEHILSMEPVGHIVLNDKDAPIPVYSRGTKLYLGATDQVVDTDRIFFRINEGEELEYNKPYKFKTPGLVTFSVRAMDKLGNTSSSEVVELFIK